MQFLLQNPCTVWNHKKERHASQFTRDFVLMHISSALGYLGCKENEVNWGQFTESTEKQVEKQGGI